MTKKKKSISHLMNYMAVPSIFGTLHIRIYRTRRHINAFARLIEIYVLIHSRIGGNGKQRARMVVDDGPRRREKRWEMERDVCSVW